MNTLTQLSEKQYSRIEQLFWNINMMSENCMDTIRLVPHAFERQADRPLTWRRWLAAGIGMARFDVWRGLDFLARCAERRRQRYALSGLDERTLSDIHLSRADVWRECSKPCWRD